MIKLDALAAANAERWVKFRLTRDFGAVARRLASPAAKARYRAVSASTGVPWAVVAVIHQRECAQDWTRSLAQGDPWARPSVHVPAGRGPFPCWEAAAIDALVDCAPFLARTKDWSIGPALAKLEAYNGLGYAARGLASPYLWAGTDQYGAGKYVRDGIYDPEAVDSQLGCAGLLKTVMDLDSSAALAAEQLSSAAPEDKGGIPQSRATMRPSIKTPANGSVGAFLAYVLAALFKRR